MEVDLETARKLLRFIELLEDNDDVRTSTPTRTSPTKSWLSWKTDWAELFEDTGEGRESAFL